MCLLLSRVQNRTKIKLVWEWDSYFFQLHPSQRLYYGSGRKLQTSKSYMPLRHWIAFLRVKSIGRTIMQRQRCQQDTIKLWIAKQRCNMETFSCCEQFYLDYSQIKHFSQISHKYRWRELHWLSCNYLSSCSWRSIKFVSVSISIYILFSLIHVYSHLWMSCSCCYYLVFNEL